MPVNFFKGHPSKRLLPSSDLSSSYSSVLSKDYDYYDSEPKNQHPLAYGTDLGNLDVRKSIANWIGNYYNLSINPLHINLTSGASYGVANILTAFTSSVTKQAFIVTPTYYLINGTFLDAGFEGKITAIDETSNSNSNEYDIDLDLLESKLKFYYDDALNTKKPVTDPERGQWKFYQFVIYLVPAFSNPGGLNYNVKTLKKLLELAREYDLLIITDDVYDLLTYTDEKPSPKLAHLDKIDEKNSSHRDYGNVISNCTFSKIVAPGLRIGWQELLSEKMTWQIGNTGANKSGGCPAQLASLVIQDFIDSGKLNENLEKLKKIYTSRSQLLIKTIKDNLPKSTVINGGKGGYFFWVTIPGDIDHNKVVDKLAPEVVLASGNHFEVSGDHRDWGKNSVRLSISYLEEEDIVKGIEEWAKVLKKEYPQLYE